MWDFFLRWFNLNRKKLVVFFYINNIFWRNIIEERILFKVVLKKGKMFMNRGYKNI